MTGRQHSIDLDTSTYAAAKDMAEREHMTIDALLASLVRSRAEYVDTFDQAEDGKGSTLAEWQMDRDAGESDEQYEARLALFR